MSEQRPLRSVNAAQLMSGRGGLLGPDNGRRTWWWEMRLSCGHVQERRATYRPAEDGLRHRQRGKSDVLPAPGRARCDTCKRDGEAWR